MIQFTDEQLRLLGRVITGDVLDSAVFPPTQWFVPGLIPEGAGLLTGPPKQGKSWLVLGLALAIAEGGLALGQVALDQPRPVLYAALEDSPKRVQWRARKLLGSATPIPERLHLVTDVTRGEILPLIELWLERCDGVPGLIILDTLAKVLPPATPGESDYQRDYRIGAHFKHLVAQYPGSTILAVHHTRKAAADDWMDSTSGTNGLNGAADFTINLHRRRNEHTGLLRITGRDVLENEYAARVVGGAWMLEGDSLSEAAKAAREDALSAGLGTDSSRLLAWLQTQPEPVSPTAAAEAMGWLDSQGRPDSKKAAVYLRRLHEQERVTKPARGLYRRVESVESVEFPPSPLFPTSHDSTDTTLSTQGYGGE